jgi:hypothetical protein
MSINAAWKNKVGELNKHEESVAFMVGKAGGKSTILDSASVSMRDPKIIS